MKYIYEHDREQWVELHGCAQLSMRELNGLYTGEQREMFGVAASVVAKASLQDRHGAPIDAQDAEQVDRLTLLQWDWLRGVIIQAARDEALDPEA